MKKFKWIIYTRAFNLFIDFVVRIYSKTFLYNVIGEKEWVKLLEAKQPVVLCGWHQQFFPFIERVKKYKKFYPAVMISKSRDGDLAAPMAFRRNCLAVRGSSSRGGKTALTQLISHVQTKGFAIHILDGPTGPMGKAKPGIIKLAQETGATLFPMKITSNRAWFFHSWDRFMLPKPFATIDISFGTPIMVPKDMDFARFEEERKNIEQTMFPYLIWPEK